MLEESVVTLAVRNISRSLDIPFSSHEIWKKGIFCHRGVQIKSVLIRGCIRANLKSQ